MIQNMIQSTKTIENSGCAVLVPSSALKIPVRIPVPMNVPMESKVSMMLNAKITTSTIGNLPISVNRLTIPPSLKIARKVVGRA